MCKKIIVLAVEAACREIGRLWRARQWKEAHRG